MAIALKSDKFFASRIQNSLNYITYYDRITTLH